MIFRPIAAFSVVLLGAIVAPGCGQGDGQVCQVQNAPANDCASGLICTCALGGGPGSRGICHAVEPATCSTSTVDAFVVPVDGGPDVGVDAGTDGGLDAGATDAGSDGGVDAGASDAGATDTGTVDAGAVDANTDAGG